MNSREIILGRLADRLDMKSKSDVRLDNARARISKHQTNTIPARGKGTVREREQLLEKMLGMVHGTVSRASRLEDLPAAIYDYLKNNGFTTDICVAQDVIELALDWSLSPGLTVTQWRARQSIAVGVTGCYGAVAETGSLVVCSSVTHAITMNFLSEVNIIVLRAGDIVGAYEEIWSKLRIESSKQMPRDLTLISSPSCTGDIEMILEYGAHGPKYLHVIIVG